MNLRKITAILLIAAGALALAYGGFTYTQDRHQADLGVVQLSFDEREYVAVPLWAGAGMLGFGVVLLLAGRRT